MRLNDLLIPAMAYMLLRTMLDVFGVCFVLFFVLPEFILQELSVWYQMFKCCSSDTH